MNKSMKSILVELGKAGLYTVLGIIMGVIFGTDISLLVKVIIAIGIVCIIILSVIVFMMVTGKKDSMSSRRMSSIEQNARVSRNNPSVASSTMSGAPMGGLENAQVQRNPLDRKPMSAEKKEQRAMNKVKVSKIMLLNEEGRSIMEWSLSSKTCLIIGKGSQKEPVDLDLSGTAEAMMISKQHAVLNYTDKGWYIDDIDSKNGTRVKKNGQNSIMDVKLVGAIEVEAGDIIYIANTVLKVE